jgi:hypothetical protein
MENGKSLNEAKYGWVRFPENLPRKNLVLSTSKTTKTTIHPSDPNYPVRLFDPKEMHDAARSLAQRPIGLNHIHSKTDPTVGLIELPPIDMMITGSKYAFTVDANWNEQEQAIESLLYLPDYIIDEIREGKIEKNSVEYIWRNEIPTPSGIKFEGFIFHRLDLLEGIAAGDSDTELIPASQLGLMEGKIGLMEGAVELVQPEKDIKQGIIQQSVDDPSLSFVKEALDESVAYAQVLGEPMHSDFQRVKDKMVSQYGEKKGTQVYYAWVNKHGYDDTKAFPKKECVEAKEPQLPEEANLIQNIPQQAVHQTPSSPEKPKTNVGSAGFVADGKGPLASDPKAGSPTEHIDVPSAENKTKLEGNTLEKSVPISGAQVSIVDPDKSKQRVESADPKPEDKKDNKPPEDKSQKSQDANPVSPPVQSTPTPTTPMDGTQPDSKDEEIKKLKKQADDDKVTITKLQDNAKVTDTEKAKAVKEAISATKKEVIEQIEAVLPSPMVSSQSKGAVILAQDIRKITHGLKESLKE